MSSKITFNWNTTIARVWGCIAFGTAFVAVTTPTITVQSVLIATNFCGRHTHCDYGFVTAIMICVAHLRTFYLNGVFVVLRYLTT